MHQTDDDATAVALESKKFILRFVAVLFGPLHTPKTHRLASHFLAELLDRGNIVEADTSINEGLHGRCMAIKERSKKHVSTFTAQMMPSEQKLACVLAEAAAECKDDDAVRGRAEAGEAAAKPVGDIPAAVLVADADVAVPDGHSPPADESATSCGESVARCEAHGAKRI